MKPLVVVVGPGRLGSSLALDVAASGESDVAVVGRSPEVPAILTEAVSVKYDGGPVASPWSHGDRAREVAVVLAVPDDQLQAVVAASAPAVGGVSVVLHTCGAQAASVLRPLAAATGAAAGSWHPLVPIASAGPGGFAGAAIGLEGDDTAVQFGRRLAAWVGARTILVPAGSKARYHAAAVFASNYLVACLHAAASELAEVTGDPRAVEALIPLARAAVENVALHGTGGGASGPITRADVETIRAHLATLDPPRSGLYRALGAELLDAVGSRLTPSDVDRIARVLEEG